MKNIKKTVIIICFAIFLSFAALTSACTNRGNDFVQSYEYYEHSNISGDLIISLKEGITLQNYYYVLVIQQYHLDSYECSTYKKILKNNNYINYLSSSSHYSMQNCAVNNRQIEIGIIKPAVSKFYNAILVYKSNEIVDKSTDLQNYIAVIELS